MQLKLTNDKGYEQVSREFMKHDVPLRLMLNTIYKVVQLQHGEGVYELSLIEGEEILWKSARII